MAAASPRAASGPPAGRRCRQSAAALALLSAATCVTGCGGSLPECAGAVQKDLRFGCAGSYDLADNICCHNTMFAERSGYFSTVGGTGLFSQLNASGVTTFYDSVCGKPLFRAPVGRSFQAWQQESELHGWPSFRKEELVSENVNILPGGEMRSVCGVHLGHNIPDGRDRYCIDLVCIAGSPQLETITE